MVPLEGTEVSTELVLGGTLFVPLEAFSVVTSFVEPESY